MQITDADHCCHVVVVLSHDELVRSERSDGGDSVTDFRGWVSSVGLHGPGPENWSRFELCALTAEGPVIMVSGPDLMALSWYPADRLALGPVTFGGMVVRRGRHSVRVTCLDTSGRFDVWVGSSAGFRRALPEASDSDAAGVMWHLMDAGATRPVLGELVGRLLLWAWLDDSHERRRLGPGGTDAVVSGVRAFARGDMDALAGLLEVPIETPVTPASITRAAMVVDHPPLQVSDPVAHRTIADEVDYLHACIPTRWSLADELRIRHRRADLADMVMAAPTPDL